MNKEIKQKKLRLKKSFKTMVRITITSIFLVLSIFIIVNSLNIRVSDSKTIMTYRTNSDIDYKVHLKNNNYFATDTLDKDGQYIASIIDVIKSKFTYSFNAKKNFDFTYKYDIKGNIIANHQVDASTEKEVWNKEYTLVQEKTKTIKDNSYFSIVEDLDIDYDEFSKYLQEFKKDFTLSINAYLKVTMTVNVDGTLDNKAIKKNSVIEMDIPLSDQTFAITTNYKPVETDSIVGETVIDTERNNYVTLFGVLLLILSLLMIIIDVRKILSFERKNDKYRKTLNKILSSYDDIIVTTKETVDISKYNVIEVESFDEMVDAQQELRIPIIYREIKEDEESWFIIIDNKQAWLYRYINEEPSHEL